MLLLACSLSLIYPKTPNNTQKYQIFKKVVIIYL